MLINQTIAGLRDALEKLREDHQTNHVHYPVTCCRLIGFYRSTMLNAQAEQARVTGWRGARQP